MFQICSVYQVSWAGGEVLQAVTGIYTTPQWLGIVFLPLPHTRNNIHTYHTNRYIHIYMYICVYWNCVCIYMYIYMYRNVGMETLHALCYLLTIITGLYHNSQSTYIHACSDNMYIYLLLTTHVHVYRHSVRVLLNNFICNSVTVRYVCSMYHQIVRGIYTLFITFPFYWEQHPPLINSFSSPGVVHWRLPGHCWTPPGLPSRTVSSL